MPDPIDELRRGGFEVDEDDDDTAIVHAKEGGIAVADEDDLGEEEEHNPLALVKFDEGSNLLERQLEDPNFNVALANYEEQGSNQGLSNATDVHKGLDLSGDKDWEHIDVRGLDFSDRDFSGRVMTGARLLGAQSLRGAKFVGTYMQGGNFSNLDCVGADFSEATCGDYLNALRKGNEVTPEDAVKIFYFDGADLRQAKFISGFFHGSSFVGCKLQCADLSDGEFAVADFTDAQMMGANCEGGIFTRAIFDGANISGVNFTDADLRGVDLSKVTDSSNVIWDRVITDKNTILPDDAPESIRSNIKKDAKTDSMTRVKVDPAEQAADEHQEALSKLQEIVKKARAKKEQAESGESSS